MGVLVLVAVGGVGVGILMGEPGLVAVGVGVSFWMGKLVLVAVAEGV